MRGIFCHTTATTNEEFRKVLQKRNICSIATIVVGLAASVTAFLASEKGITALSDHILGVYCGVGCGLAAAALILLIKNLRILKDENKLKKSRLEQYDERLQEINQKAINMAAMVMIFFAFAGGLIGGIFYPVLIKALLIIVYVFLFSYLIAYAVYKKSM